MLKPRFLYIFVLWLLLPYLFIRLFWRARRQPDYLHHIAERFGFYSQTGSRPIIWLHTVSVGETRAAQTIIDRLQAEYHDHQILLTFSTPTGRAAGKQLYGNSVLRVYLPYDYPFAVKGFLRKFKPHIGILMETEIWLNLIHACRDAKVPLLLLNARMSEKSARGYARFTRLTREALTGLFAIAAQSDEDAARLVSLGAKSLSVTGNLKFDILPPADLLDLGKKMRAFFGASRKIFLAASTRNGEEKLLLDRLIDSHVQGLLLVIVPRHPQRFAEVENMLYQRGISFIRKSDIFFEPNSSNKFLPDEIQVVLGNTMGELFGYYAAADIAFIGGSLLPFGGQNLIESCAVGTPVLIGPHYYNFKAVTLLAAKAGAALVVNNAEELTNQLQKLMSSPLVLEEMRHNCSEFVASNRGATDKSMKIIANTIQTH